MSAYFSPVGNEPQTNANGDPISGGKWYTYLAGTTTPAATYTDSTGGTPLSNPIILNSRGVPTTNGTTPATIWIAGGVSLKFVLTDSADVPIAPTFDNINGINDPALATATDEWVLFTGAPTYISATSFSVVGDQTNTLQVNRRIKTGNTGGTTYSTIKTSTYAAGPGLTTVVVTNTSGVLDSGLSTLYYGFLSYTNGSVPVQTGQLINVQSFTATGVYTPTPGTASIIVELQGGGGGSGGCVATAAGQWAAGAPGAGGGWGRRRITSAFSGVTVTIGAGGTAGAAGNNAGGNGGTSSFGAIVTCGGGDGGAGSGAVQTAIGFGGGVTASYANGGAPALAEVGRVGSSPGATIALSVSQLVRANGGDAYWGSGGKAGVILSNNAAGITPGGFGGGAAGPAQCNGVFAAAPGAAGAPGVAYIYEYA